MFNAYMLTSTIFQRVYMAWVARMDKLAKSGQWSQEWENARKQVQRMQEMYDDLEDGRIIYLWQWHKMALGKK